MPANQKFFVRKSHQLLILKSLVCILFGFLDIFPSQKYTKQFKKYSLAPICRAEVFPSFKEKTTIKSTSVYSIQPFAKAEAFPIMIEGSPEKPI